MLSPGSRSARAPAWRTRVYYIRGYANGNGNRSYKSPWHFRVNPLVRVGCVFRSSTQIHLLYFHFFTFATTRLFFFLSFLIAYSPPESEHAVNHRIAPGVTLFASSEKVPAGIPWFRRAEFWTNKRQDVWSWRTYTERILWQFLPNLVW